MLGLKEKIHNFGVSTFKLLASTKTIL